MQAVLQLHSRSTSVCLRNVDADEIGLEDWNPFICAVNEGFWASSGPTSPRMLRFTPERVCRVSSQLFAVAVSHCLTLAVGHIARMPDNVPAKAVLRVACDVRDGVPPFPNWRRSRCRPPITWLHQICSDCGLSAGDALNCAQDRAVWRPYATASSASRCFQ